jgi:hypothetical protein
MPYSTTISALDFSPGVANVHVSAGYAWNEVGGPHPGEKTQEEVGLELTSLQFLSQSNPPTFSYAGNLAPQPKADWFITLWIQESARVSQGWGWLFRSGAFTSEPPSEPIEVILAPEQLIGDSDLAGKISTPTTSGTTTVTSVTTMVNGINIDFTATGTDTHLPSGEMFTFTATLELIPNSKVMDEQSPFEIAFTNANLSFVAGTGHGFETAILNAISGPIWGQVEPQIHSTIKGMLNDGVLSDVATRINRGVPASMPAGVVLSIRSLRGTTRTKSDGTTESVIGVLGALGAFGGVTNKFPALAGGGRCFIATAATSPAAPEVQVLQAWRDLRLRRYRRGALLVAGYERASPRLAAWVARTPRRRSLARRLVVVPAARLAARSLRRLATPDQSESRAPTSGR